MYAGRYFPSRYFADRYWPKVGSDQAAEPLVLDLYWSANTTFTVEWSAATTLAVSWSSTMSVTTHLRFVAGEAITLSFSPEGGDESISGWTLRFRVYDLSRSSLQLTATSGSGLTVVSTSAGTFTVTALTATVTGTTLGAGKWYWDLWRTDSGSETELGRGTLEIRA